MLFVDTQSRLLVALEGWIVISSTVLQHLNHNTSTPVLAKQLWCARHCTTAVAKNRCHLWLLRTEIVDGRGDGALQQDTESQRHTDYTWRNGLIDHREKVRERTVTVWNNKTPLFAYQLSMDWGGMCANAIDKFTRMRGNEHFIHYQTQPSWGTSIKILNSRSGWASLT